MKGLITDRTLRNVARRNELATKGWANMTTAERTEWEGNPFIIEGTNLLPCGPFYSSVVNLKYRNAEIVATATAPGVYLYAISIIGPASNYAGKTYTLSVDQVIKTAGVAQLALYWHGDNGFEYAGASLTGAGSVTVDLSLWPNTAGRAYLALYVYVTTSETVTVGTTTRFVGVMFENGSVRHEYVPYTEILPTLATKGAYNYSDLNRVERAVSEISDLAGLGLVTQTDWGMWDIPTASDMTRYLGNIKTIKTRYNINIALPDSMNQLTYETANNIEKILLAAYQSARGA